MPDAQLTADQRTWAQTPLLQLSDRAAIALRARALNVPWSQLDLTDGELKTLFTHAVSRYDALGRLVAERHRQRGQHDAAQRRRARLARQNPQAVRIQELARLAAERRRRREEARDQACSHWDEGRELEQRAGPVERDDESLRYLLEQMAVLQATQEFDAGTAPLRRALRRLDYAGVACVGRRTGARPRRARPRARRRTSTRSCSRSGDSGPGSEPEPQAHRRRLTHRRRLHRGASR